jgi:FlaG/FlaF family flagellin (archaellin)
MLNHKVLGDERGVSVILGAALLIGIIIAFVAAFLATWIPGQVGQKEATQLQGVGDSFRQLRTTIANIQEGEFRSVDVNMSANYSIPLVPNSKQVGTLSVTPAQVTTVRIYPDNDAYIDDNRPNDIFLILNFFNPS